MHSKLKEPGDGPFLHWECLFGTFGHRKQLHGILGCACERLVEVSQHPVHGMLRAAALNDFRSQAAYPTEASDLAIELSHSSHWSLSCFTWEFPKIGDPNVVP